jgi:glycosyltransferase involved in cell wall biosynthesis
VCGGTEDAVIRDDSVTRIVCRRSRFGFPLDTKHDFDLAFWRHYNRVFEAVRTFAPDIVHITGPSDVGQLGALVAGRLHVPLAASWHTNLHEYAERRALRWFGALPRGLQQRMGAAIRGGSLAPTLLFYRLARVLFAPNPELTELLAKGTGKPIYPMNRGVDTELFAPHRRDRHDAKFTVGYVGRLTTEKNIRFLAELEHAMENGGFPDFGFSIVGQGAEEEWLRSRMRRARFHGVLRGEALARAYANMDVFVFPSRTDTFGNVVLEALASGVPAIVTEAGGPRYLVRHQETGFVASHLREVVGHLRRFAGQPQQLQSLRDAARASALGFSWDGIFTGMYDEYARELQRPAQATTKIGIGARRRAAISN